MPHLGKTASASGQIRFGEGVTRGQVRGVLDRFWRGTAAYASAHGGRFAEAKETDWAKVRFKDSLTLNVADERSIGRLTDSWGWTWRKSFGYSSAGWVFPLDVEGTEITVRQGGYRDAPWGTDFDLGGEVALPSTVDVDRWLETEGKQLRWATFLSGGDHTVYPHLDIDLRKGVSLGDIRRQIKTFAQNVAALKRAYDGL